MKHPIRSLSIVLFLIVLLVSPLDSISSMGGSIISFPQPCEFDPAATAVDRANSDSNRFEQYIDQMYIDFGLEEVSLESSIFRYAVLGYYNLKKTNSLKNISTLSVIDYQKSSNEPRLYVLDLSKRKILFNTLVSHGRNSGNEYAKKFSNVPQSYTTSLGFYITKHTYSGKHGYSLRLEGRDKGFNCKAEQRAIVVHAADYVCKDFAKKHGRIGRSLGCPALPATVSKSVIDEIKNRSCLFAYYPDQNYLTNSKYLNFSTALEQFVIAS